jgi:hypothetical protein
MGYVDRNFLSTHERTGLFLRNPFLRIFRRLGTRRRADHKGHGAQPHHPGWYHFSTFFNEYRQGHHAEALAIAQKINMPEYFPTYYVVAMTRAKLCRHNGDSPQNDRLL